jgi:hypothetical protein
MKIIKIYKFRGSIFGLQLEVDATFINMIDKRFLRLFLRTHSSQKKKLCRPWLYGQTNSHADEASLE